MQITAYNAQVEAHALTKKETGNIRHYALKGQQLNVRGWCMESAAIINIKCYEVFIGRLPRKLKDFAHKRQIRPESTVVQTPIPFHTLVKLVDAEYIMKEKNRAVDHHWKLVM